MSVLERVGFGLQFAQGRSKFVSQELAENCYVEASPDSDRSKVSLVGTPGLRLLFSVGDGPIRGVHELNDDLFVVSGQELYLVQKAGGETFTSTIVGTIGSSGPVDMTANATHVAVVTRAQSYYANATTLGILPETSLFGASYQDGYAIFARIKTEDFYITPVDDLTTINALDFSNADSFPDKLVGHISDHGEVGLFGSRSIEWWQNTGNQDFPFVRAQRIEWGCGAGQSIAKEDNQVFFLDHQFRVCRSVGYQIEPISTPAIDYAISQQGASRKTARGFTYVQDGHLHYVLRFDGLSLCYDASTKRWHKRSSWDLDRWRAESYAYHWDLHIVGDYQNGNIYALDLDTFTDNGDRIRRRVYSPGPWNQGNLAITDELYADFESGVGLAVAPTAEGYDPQVRLKWTDDNGKTWSKNYPRSLGKQGENENRCRWHRLGASRDRVYSLEMTDPVRFRMLGAYARMERLAA